MTPNLLRSPSPHARPGTVTLVGAGPGDPELLTLKAVKAIAAATLILVDELVNPAVLSHAHAEARIVQVGKRGGCRSTPQDFINKLLVRAAQDGEYVVRLKGGDPFIFGRGGEEAEHLRAAGIEVQVVNGITAGLAGLTALGAPLTHRDHAQGVIFITGHVKPGTATGSHGTGWPQLAATARDAKLTLVIYMGTSSVAQIEADLLKGLPAETPVAIIQHASLPEQRHALCCLSDLSHTLQTKGLASPAVMVVGDVVRGVAAVAHHGSGEFARAERIQQQYGLLPEFCTPT